MQRQIDQAQGGALGPDRGQKTAPDHDAVDDDLDVRQMQFVGVGMLFEHGIAQLIQGELADRLDPVLEGLSGVLLLNCRQIHQVAAVSGEVTG
ncbi:hypothetical protein D3C71_1518200 [compost metagenome]